MHGCEPVGRHRVDLQLSESLAMNDADAKAAGLSYASLQKVFSEQQLFENKTWRYSPKAFPLSAKQVAEIELIGQACYEFYRATETLYLRSATDRKILRNRDLYAPWVAEYLDRGKPEALVRHARSEPLRGSTPAIIRPDLLITEAGFALTEIDSVPGGIGLTAFLNQLYAEEHAGALIGSGDQNMLEAFYSVLSNCAPGIIAPHIAILMSDETRTFRPEMEWLANELRMLGRRVHVYHTDEMIPLGESISVDVEGEPQTIDVIYRFWELFDLDNVPAAQHLIKARGESSLALTPPMRPFQEEKLSLALFHHHALKDFWKENLTQASHKVLNHIIPMTWIIDPIDLPPNAVLNAPSIGGGPITDWLELADASRKERSLIIKISGFHEDAWGARSVTLGSDSSRTEWKRAIEQAIAMADTSPHVLQLYAKPSRHQHPVYKDDGSLYQMESRVRLCPYYFVDEKTQQARLNGVLATLCPADKKIIHGMKDAALLPCVESQDLPNPTLASHILPPVPTE